MAEEEQSERRTTTTTHRRGGGGGGGACRNHHLRVVLFVKGRGNANGTYRPTKDESQWWGRRDALVRCVAAFLCGPPAPRAGPLARTSRELVLLYDEDWCRIHMTYEAPPPPLTAAEGDDDDDDNTNRQQGRRRIREQQQHVVPTERNVVALWKRCSQKNEIGNVVEENGLSARMVLCDDGNGGRGSSSSERYTLPSPSGGRAAAAAAAACSSGDTAPLPSPPTSMEGKRDILAYLQRACSIDFLRLHHLNSSPAAILRKTTKRAMLEVLQKWQQQRQQQRHREKKSPKEDDKAKEEEVRSSSPLQAVLQDLLSSSTHNRVVAGTLHESSDAELPCWNLVEPGVVPSATADDNGAVVVPSTLVCLFLGAVRDMRRSEAQCLRRACSKAYPIRIPLVRVRLGPVAEFTSKILSVVAFHQSRGVLVPALCRQVEEQQQDHLDVGPRSICNRAPSDETSGHTKDGRRKGLGEGGCTSTAASQRTPPALLHFICFIPINADQVTIDLYRRDRVLWCLVRCVVASLWRSRVATAIGCAADGTTSTTGACVHQGGDSDADASPTNRFGPLRTRLSLVFDDAIVLSLNQEDVVNSLAEQHQAAPSEYQILKFVRDRLVATAVASSVLDDLLVELSTTQQQNLVPAVALSFFGQGGKDIAGEAYSYYRKNEDKCSGKTGIILLPVAENASADTEDHRRRVVRALHKKQVPVVASSVLSDTTFFPDRAAATISMVQHLCYQDRLFPVVCRDGEEAGSWPSGQEGTKRSCNKEGNDKKRKKKMMKRKKRHKRTVAAGARRQKGRQRLPPPP